MFLSDSDSMKMCLRTLFQECSLSVFQDGNPF